MQIDFDIKKQKAIIADSSDISVIREYFSIENPAAKFQSRFSRFIPKRLYAISPLGQFDIGLIDEIQKVIVTNQLHTDVQLTANAKKAYNPSLPIECSEGLTKTLRNYQVDAVNACLGQGRGVVVMGTGAGKTLTIAALIQSVFYKQKLPQFFKCLLIVPDLGLVRQTYDDFIEYGVDMKITRWTGSNQPDFSANIIIANTAILQRQFEDNPDMKCVDLVIVDEVHKLTNSSILSKILQKIDTYNKFGFTGTLSENKLDKWNTIGKIGPILYEKTSAELRDEKFLTNVIVNVINISYNEKPKKIVNKTIATEQYIEELEFIKANSFRNRVIKTTCSNFNNNILILVNYIEHGQILLEHLSSLEGKKVYFIQGEVEIEERENIKKIMEIHSNVVCIAMSSIFSTGVNVKNIHMIVFAAGGKSFIRTVQSIGRGLRLHENKEKLIILDIADDLEYGKKHSQKRKEIYSEQNIVYKESTLIEK